MIAIIAVSFYIFRSVEDKGTASTDVCQASSEAYMPTLSTHGLDVPDASDISNESLPGLIQSVSDMELYRGFITYGDYKVHTISSSDTTTAYDNVRACIVRISMNGAGGSGIVWKMEPDRIVIVSNRHVLEYWDDQTGFVSFVDGTVSNAKLIGMSGKHDVGFLQIPAGWLDYESLHDIRQASYNMDSYNSVKHGDAEFGLGSANGAAADFYPGFIDSRDTYMSEFGDDMIYCDSNAIHGMSGGGTFDGHGSLIGMVTGGSDYNISVSVPLPSMIEAYDMLVGSD